MSDWKEQAKKETIELLKVKAKYSIHFFRRDIQDNINNTIDVALSVAEKEIVRIVVEKYNELVKLTNEVQRLKGIVRPMEEEIYQLQLTIGKYAEEIEGLKKK